MQRPNDRWWWSSMTAPMPSAESTILSFSEINGVDPISLLNTLTADDSGRADLVEKSDHLFPIVTHGSKIQHVVRSVSDHSSPLSAAVSTTQLSSLSNMLDVNSKPICIGDGLDAASEGVLASLVVSSALGFVCWLVFVIVRPRFRQIYSPREWFVQQHLRPKPLSSSPFAFLFPQVPLVPSVPHDVPITGPLAVDGAKLFPSDEQLNQRTLWIAYTVVLGWSILGIASALPLYLVSLPCIAQTGSQATFGGVYSTLQDLSLIRLLRTFDQAGVSTSNLNHIRAISDPHHARVRVIVLTVLTLMLGLLPALWKILRELNNMVAYRRSFVDVRCVGQELGWLSANRAPGFVGWGEKQMKDYILKIGLGYSMEVRDRRNNTQTRNGRVQNRKSEEQPLNYQEEASLSVNIQSLFSIGDTQALALLIEERDEILENLEIAEARYISSFRMTTPDPSIADFEPPLPPPKDPSRPYISRPLPLVPGSRRGGRRTVNPAFAASSLAPTSFVAPSQYYKLRNVKGVSGGRFADSGLSQHASTNSSVIGSNFMEVNRNSVADGRLPVGSHVIVEKSGQLGPRSPVDSGMFSIPDPRRFGPNYGINLYNLDEADEQDMGNESEPNGLDEEWVDLIKETPSDLDSAHNGTPNAGPSSFRRRPKQEPVTASRRETFPLRKDHYHNPDFLPPPHLRLQPSQPFVRPLDGLNFDDLGHVYEDITQWRSRLKAINAEIADAQRESYNDIADGARIKGWLMVGRGLRFIPGIQLIEGRAKEDIRWDVLQTERSWMDSAVLWAVVGVVLVMLAAGLTAASGLALSTAPDVAHYLPFLGSLLQSDRLATGIASVFAPAIAAILFIIITLIIVNWVVTVHGSISISANQLLIFKTTFYILTIASLWLITVGALLHSMHAFSVQSGISKSIADGSIYMGVLALSIVVALTIISPGLLLLQPVRLWRVLQAERQALTPRQRFRAVYPRTYNPSFATGACVLGIVFASACVLVFPLVGPAVTILLFLTLIAHRYLVGYVYARTHSQTGGLLQIWLLKRFGTLLSLQPIILGLIFLSRRFWIEGGILVGTGIGVIFFVEAYATWKTRLPGRDSLSPITRESLRTFEITAKTSRRTIDEEGISHISSARSAQRRNSMASVLDMMSVTLGVMPSTHQGPVPLQTETLDDLTATERAARTHPDAPPHLPPLSFTDHAEDVADILYAPELIAPQPIIWLPNDSAGVARSEAVDLQKYHNLRTVLDVRATEDVLPRHSPSTRHRPSR